MGADGNTIYFSYDEPKNSSTLAVDFSIWSGTLTGKLASKLLTNSNPFTGGDVDPTPLANGAVLYSKFAIGNGNAYSEIAIQVKPLARPVVLTTPAQDCGQPAPSPDGTRVAMICIGGTGLQSTRLEVATLNNGKLGIAANAGQQLPVRRPGMGAGRQRARLLQRRRCHGPLRAVVDQGCARAPLRRRRCG